MFIHKRGREISHKINPPNIKYLNLKNFRQKVDDVSLKTPLPLTFHIALKKGMDISKYYGKIVTTLEYQEVVHIHP